VWNSRVRIVISGVGDTGGEHQECQSEEFAERGTRGYMSSGVGDVVEDFVVSSYRVAGERVGIGGVELGSGAFDGSVERDIGRVLTMESAGMATAQNTTWPESANHFAVVLGLALEGVVLDNSLGRQWVKCKVHPVVRRSPATDVCPVRLVGDGYIP
jgi:hypothetical protein